ncbi:MAG: hypothetical protein HFE78_04285 [Clostridiales bacterium]|nr:hypothetical protein [Clostridiales bacterium]
MELNMYFSDKEENIIHAFYTNIKLHQKDELILKWDEENCVVAKFDTCFDDDNDLEMEEEGYEEFTSFAFTVISVSGNPPVYITGDNGFLIDYHNFPNEILADGKKIN